MLCPVVLVVSWAFSAVEVSESAWFLSGHSLHRLSVQQVIDCDYTSDNQGCNGGTSGKAFEYITKEGLMGERDYPFDNSDPHHKSGNLLAGIAGDFGWKSHRCEFNNRKVVAFIDTFLRATDSRDEQLLAENIFAYGPATVAVDGSHSWQSYRGGILFPESCSSHLRDADHEVVVVGLGISQDGYKYWIVKNQWSADWGEDGYIRLLYGHNTCGLANDAYVAKSRG